MSNFFSIGLVLGFALLLTGCMGEKEAEKSGGETLSARREEIALRLAHATETTGDMADAERMYLNDAAAYPRSLESHVELAEFYRRHNNIPQAIAAYNGALKIDPANVSILHAMANIYISAGQTRQAIALLDRAITLNDKDPLLYNSKGIALDMEGHYPQAQASYKTALSLNPADAMTFDANLSMSYILSGSYNQAINLLQPMLNNPGVTPTIRQNLAMAYGMKGENDKALTLGLKDLTPEQASENLKFYRMVKRSSNAGNYPQTARDVFPGAEDTQSPQPDSNIIALHDGIPITLPLPTASSYPPPALMDRIQNDGHAQFGKLASTNIPPSEIKPLPKPSLREHFMRDSIY